MTLMAFPAWALPPAPADGVPRPLLPSPPPPASPQWGRAGSGGGGGGGGDGGPPGAPPPPPHPPVSLPPLAHAAAASAAASVTALFVTPLDVVKVRMQAHVCTPLPDPCAVPGHAASMADAARQIIAAHGPRGLWRGLPATFAIAVPSTGLYFCLYEAFCRGLRGGGGGGGGGSSGGGGGEALRPSLAVLPPDAVPAVAGATARCVATLAGAPLELGRLRLQAGAPSGIGAGAGLRGALAGVVAADGVVGLWRGAGVTLLRDAPFSAIYWGAYEALKAPGGGVPWLLGRRGQREEGPAGAARPAAAGAAADTLTPPPAAAAVGGGGGGGGVDTPVHLLSGVGAGVLAAAATVPADVVKTRWQAGERGAPGGPAGVAAVARGIVAAEGLRGLTRGVGPRVAKVAPSCAIMMASYEALKGLALALAG
ncbi:hypothetical protein I4F81_005936 [Pyropia yezoensis]|uniref:Uncharacterized protein n=1 Tax=Pyropia yezoensis TaxID=2788 RepID=A0ACC3BZV0_PYRYE|nr:hypothetical protein I4F81_005936 [Neopyropia yezoensis]